MSDFSKSNIKRCVELWVFGYVCGVVTCIFITMFNNWTR